MSLVEDFHLGNYETVKELEEALMTLEDERSILRGYTRGVEEKLETLRADKEHFVNEVFRGRQGQ